MTSESGGRVLDGTVETEGLGDRVGRVIRLAARGERARAHVVGETLDGACRVTVEVGVPAYELGSPPVLEPEDVVVHEHLAVAVTARADTDRRHGHRVGDHARHR